MVHVPDESVMHVSKREAARKTWVQLVREVTPESQSLVGAGTLESVDQGTASSASSA